MEHNTCVNTKGWHALCDMLHITLAVPADVQCCLQPSNAVPRHVVEKCNLHYRQSTPAAVRMCHRVTSSNSVETKSQATTDPAPARNSLAFQFLKLAVKVMGLLLDTGSSCWPVLGSGRPGAVGDCSTVTGICL
jgi:hypothetical protein